MMRRTRCAGCRVEWFWAAVLVLITLSLTAASLWLAFGPMNPELPWWVVIGVMTVVGTAPLGLFATMQVGVALSVQSHCPIHHGAGS